MFLLCLMLIPFFSGIISWQMEFFNKLLSRWCALFGMSITFVLALFLWYRIGGKCISGLENYALSGWQLEYIFPWIPSFGINFHLALDGLSLLMIILSGLLGVLSVLCSWKEINRQEGFFYFNLLWLISCVIAMFLSIDMFFFFFFWEMMIFPMYLLISLWGHKASNSGIRVRAAMKFFVYTQVSGLIMLVAIVGLVFVNYNTSGVWTFSYKDLLFMSIPRNIEYLLMLGFFIAFSIKLPIVPFHGWLSDAHSEAPTAGSVDLSGILLKTAAYGLFRFNLPLFPNASRDFSLIAMCLGIITIFYSAWIAFGQTDIKRLVAYSSISHMGFVLLSIYSGDLLSYQGAVVHIVAHSLSSSGMFILCGQLFERLHTRDMKFMGGLWDRLHLFCGLSLFFSLCMLSFPGTGNFIGEVLILFGSFRHFPIITLIAVFGIIFSSVYSLILIHRVFFGVMNVRDKSFCFSLDPMTFRERLIVFPLLFFILFLGLFPQPVIDISFISINGIYQCFTQSVVLS